MRFIRYSSDNEMIAEFLRAEMRGRFKSRLLRLLKKHQIARKIIDQPDIKDTKQNNLRKKLLKDHRGYSKNVNLFNNFPEKIRWEKVCLTAKDFLKIKYINYKYWNELSKGSRSAIEAAKNIKAGIKVFGKDPKRFFLNVARSLSSQRPFPMMIFVATRKNSKTVVLEGHVRLTAYMIRPQKIPHKIEAIIGYSRQFIKWNSY